MATQPQFVGTSKTYTALLTPSDQDEYIFTAGGSGSWVRTINVLSSCEYDVEANLYVTPSSGTKKILGTVIIPGHDAKDFRPVNILEPAHFPCMDPIPNRGIILGPLDKLGISTTSSDLGADYFSGAAKYFIPRDTGQVWPGQPKILEPTVGSAGAGPITFTLSSSDSTRMGNRISLVANGKGYFILKDPQHVGTYSGAWSSSGFADGTALPMNGYVFSKTITLMIDGTSMTAADVTAHNAVAGNASDQKSYGDKHTNIALAATHTKHYLRTPDFYHLATTNPAGTAIDNVIVPFGTINDDILMDTYGRISISGTDVNATDSATGASGDITQIALAYFSDPVAMTGLSPSIRAIGSSTTSTAGAKVEVVAFGGDF